MKLTVLGCGDAFGSGGRLQTSYHVEHAGGTFLIDCGATSLIGMARLSLAPDAVDTIFISHLHGDHFGGLVWWMLHGQHVAKRTTPLTVVGPPGIASRFEAAAEALFPGSTKIAPRFEMRFVDLARETPLSVAGLEVTAFEVVHPSGAPSYALRFSLDDRIVSFSGDTEWVETLIAAGRHADLFIMECYAVEGPTRYHLSWQVIEQNLARIAAKRVMLTHMSTPMLAAAERLADRPGILLAEDGLVLRI
jgi:ribonuclease BN (tRNA processing enzyme)